MRTDIFLALKILVHHTENESKSLSFLFVLHGHRFFILLTHSNLLNWSAYITSSFYIIYYTVLLVFVCVSYFDMKHVNLNPGILLSSGINLGLSTYLGNPGIFSTYTYGYMSQ